MQIKLFLSILVVLAFFESSEAQSLKLKIESSISQENKLIKSIGYLDSFQNYKDLEREIQSFKNTMYNLGYIETKVQSTSTLNSITSVQILLGNKYENIKIYARKNIEQGTIIDSKNFSEFFYLAIPLQKGQISCREIINGISVTQDVSKDKPLTVEHIDGPYNTESDLKKMILNRGFEVI